MHVLLASKSPRRRELLDQIGVRYKTVDVDVPELRQEGESPKDYCSRLALSKAQAGHAVDDTAPCLGADTIVVCDEEVFEKPKDLDDAKRMLRKLSGRKHEVITSVAICACGTYEVSTGSSEVEFIDIDDDMIERYWQTGEPQDKAGAYGIQGLGAVFVCNLRGSYSGVVGLPIEGLFSMLERFDIAIWNR